MVDRSRSGGVAVVATVAVALGLLHLVFGVATVTTAGGPLVATVPAVARTVLGAILLPTAVGLVRGAPWSRYVGVVALGGIAIVQLLLGVRGGTFGLPLAGILLASGSALYLLLAPGEFDGGGDGRELSEDTDPHDFVR